MLRSRETFVRFWDGELYFHLPRTTWLGRSFLPLLGMISRGSPLQRSACDRGGTRDSRYDEKTPRDAHCDEGTDPAFTVTTLGFEKRTTAVTFQD